jgi:hypothetical protein
MASTVARLFALVRRARLSGVNPNETLRLYAHTMSAGMLAGAADGAREGHAARRRAQPAPLPLDGALPGQALLNNQLTDATLKRAGATACIAFLFHLVGLRDYSCRAAVMQHDPHEDTDGRALVVPGAVRELLLEREGRLHAQDPHGRSSVRGEQGLIAQIEAQLGHCLLGACACMLLDICETHSFVYFRKHQATFLTASDNFLTRLSTLEHDLHPAVLLRPSKPSPVFPGDAPNANPREVKPYLSPETETEPLLFSPAFARRPDRAVHQHLQPKSALEGPSHRHRYSRCAPQAQRPQRRGRRRLC